VPVLYTVVYHQRGAGTVYCVLSERGAGTT
jgi:hypothetical protein